jgi:hypothetical protein
MKREQHNARYGTQYVPSDTVSMDLDLIRQDEGERYQYDSACTHCFLHRAHNWAQHDESIKADERMGR